MNRGVALPATLLALAMTSALAVGGLYVARRHAASAAELDAAISLVPGVERAVVDAVVQWDSLARAEQPIGVTQPLIAGPDVAAWVTRATELEYLIVAEARTRTRPVLYHRIGLTLVVQAGRPRLAYPRAWSLLP